MHSIIAAARRPLSWGETQAPARHDEAGVKFPEILSIVPKPGEFTYDEQFTMLYALALGAGGCPDDLPFVYEKQLRALPTMAVLMAAGSGEFITGGEVEYSMIVHGEQRLTIHRPLPSAGRMTSTARCLGVVDKGRNKGALLNLESTICDAASGEAHATSIMSLFCRGDGGFGGPATGALPLHPIPDRTHDFEVSLPTLPQQAALYRLLGDHNPLHIDPEVATAVGFAGPILHGLCTYGIAGRAILQACCGNDPAMIERLDARFSSPVYPGERVVTRMWRDSGQVSFECHAPARGATVIRNGLCILKR
jgi:acyl dehydratase